MWDVIVGARPPLVGHVLQRARVDDDLKPHVSAQRGHININHHHQSGMGVSLTGELCLDGGVRGSELEVDFSVPYHMPFWLHRLPDGHDLRSEMETKGSGRRMQDGRCSCCQTVSMAEDGGCALNGTLPTQQRLNDRRNRRHNEISGGGHRRVGEKKIGPVTAPPFRLRVSSAQRGRAWPAVSGPRPLPEASCLAAAARAPSAPSPAVLLNFLLPAAPD